MKRFFGNFSKLLTVAVIGLAACGSAQANLVVAVASTSNSSSTTGVAGNGVFNTAVSITNAGGLTSLVLNNSVTAATRFASGSAADNGSNSAADTVTGVADYTATFSVNLPVGYLYRIDIGSRLTGGLTVVDDYALGNGTNGIASVGNVTGDLNAVNEATLNLTTTASQGGSSGSSQTAVNQSNTYTQLNIAGTGANQNYAVRIRFNQTSNSQTNTSTFDNSDEVGTRFGIGNIQGSNAADDYPGVGGRDINNDGHFLTFTAQITQVPEPSSALLVLSSLVGLVGFRRRAC
jgi:hypothetical protein